jgi:hypothetical protein
MRSEGLIAVVMAERRRRRSRLATMHVLSGLCKSGAVKISTPVSSEVPGVTGMVVLGIEVPSTGLAT